MLRERAERLLAMVEAEDRYESVAEVLKGLLDGLADAETQKGPLVLNRTYVAFHRRQGDRLDLIEQTLVRIKSALRPGDMSTRIGFPMKPPSGKTTWMIIYIVLGFLAFVSLLFFFRWFGKSKAEGIDHSGQE